MSDGICDGGAWREVRYDVSPMNDAMMREEEVGEEDSEGEITDTRFTKGVEERRRGKSSQGGGGRGEEVSQNGG